LDRCINFLEGELRGAGSLSFFPNFSEDDRFFKPEDAVQEMFVPQDDSSGFSFPGYDEPFFIST